MAANESTPPLRLPLDELERMLISEYVRARGFDPSTVDTLPPAERDALLTDASVYASSKMAEVESRSHFVHEIHDGSAGTKTGLG